MSGLSNSAYCKPGDHFVPRGTATAYRQGDFAGLVCPEHLHKVEAHTHYCPKCERDVDCEAVKDGPCLFKPTSAMTCASCAQAICIRADELGFEIHPWEVM